MTFLDEMSKSVVLLGIAETAAVPGHWTVSNRITSRQIQLFDSLITGRKRINRIHCTTSENLGRPYVLCPAQAYFLARE
jgi:hypothetical protein